MRKNLSQVSNELGAARYHEQLDRLDQAGYDVAELRLDPERNMFRRVTSSNDLTHETTYADRKTVYLGVLEQKLDAIPLFFDISGRNEPIGFAAPLKPPAAY
ncbi:MAG: hypothetical protein M3464_05815 [Chloroflexota bacterium]|nr:hypothetical protein [Chloroflexota bacterium]